MFRVSGRIICLALVIFLSILTLVIFLSIRTFDKNTTQHEIRVMSGQLPLEITPYVESNDVPQGLKQPTHIGFFNGLEIISDSRNNRFVYRRKGSTDSFSESRVGVEGPHSMIWVNNKYYAVNTAGDEVIEFSDIANDRGSAVPNYFEVDLKRPHDIVYNADDGYVYVIDGNKGLTRFDPTTSDPAEVSGVYKELDYARSLTVEGGKVYIINSSKGEVIRMENFNKWTVYKSPGKKAVVEAGSWDSTGLVLNDVERYGDYWYASNAFSPAFAGKYDARKYRLIRWRTWKDFENGNWEELSYLLPWGVVPYYFTVDNGILYLATYRSSRVPGSNGKIYKLYLR